MILRVLKRLPSSVLPILLLAFLVNSASAQFWTKTGAISLKVQSLGLSPSGTLFAGTGDQNGLYRSSDHGASWTQCTTNIDLSGDFRSIAASRAGVVYAADFSKGLYRSTEDGLNWDLVATAKSAFSVAVAPDGTVYFGRDSGVFISTDNGNNWTFSGIAGATKIPAIAIDSAGNAYASDYGITSSIYKSTNRGVSWTKTAFQDNDATQVNAIGVTHDGKVFAGEESLYLSTNGGTSWTKTTGQLHGRSAIAIDSNNIVFLPDYGAMSSHVYFDTWLLNSSGWNEQENVITTGLAVDGQNYLYASSEAGTFYRSTMPTTTLGVRHSVVGAQSSLFPNPAHTQASIAFEIASPLHASLTIENVLGAVVLRVDLGLLNSGSHLIKQNFDLPEGTYSYRISAGEAITIGRMIVVR